ncbi:hypothetical protein DL96DRAFT_1776316 [Flagelloscypha sp. PMI_526]|nr:hypothetical protein DL96DRAFT_1776316 [Flagelloscypha sp. PMI_526]
MGVFQETIGATLLGFSLKKTLTWKRSLYLYGIVSYQYLTYKNTKFEDPIWLREKPFFLSFQSRVLVAILFVIDTALTAVEFYAVWYFTVENYTNPSVLGQTIWITPVACVLTAISSSIVQAFWIHRLYRLTKQRWLCGFLVLGAAASSLCGIIESIKIGMLIDITKFAALIPLTTAWLATEAGVDILITIALSRALWKNKTQSARTNALINRCIMTSIQSGLFTSVFAIACLLAFILSPKTYLYAIFAWPLVKTYSNSLLYTLVSRKELAKIAYGTAPALEVGANSFPMSPQISSVHIQRETVTDAKASDGHMNTSMDRYIVFSHSESTT